MYNLFGFNVYYLIFYFIIFSFLGWVMETVRVSIRNKKYINRGFVTGPVCPIYGIGMIIIIIFLTDFKNNYIILIISGSILATILEYITSVLLELIFHAKWWDYSYRKYNINGRVSIDISCAWGILSFIMIEYIVPFIDIFIYNIPIKIGIYFIYLFFVLFFIDLLFTVYSLLSLQKILIKVKNIRIEIKEFFSDVSGHIKERFKQDEIKSKFKTLVTDYIKEKEYIKEGMYIKLNYFIEKYMEFEDAKDRVKISDKFKKLKYKYNKSIKSFKFTHKRIFNAFPKFKVKDIELNKIIDDIKKK